MGDDEDKETARSIAKAQGLQFHCIPTERCGALNVYIQGDIEPVQKSYNPLGHSKARTDDDGNTTQQQAVFLTVHNAGANHQEWLRFANHPAMAPIKNSSVFIHIDLPGQEANAELMNLGKDAAGNDKKYPTMQEFGEDLVNILDTLRVKYVIGIGHGAGANIMMRFGMVHSQRCLGIVLLHPTAMNATLFDNIAEKVTSRKKSIGLGSGGAGEVSEYQVNIMNMAKYVQSFQDRDDVSDKLKTQLKVDCLLVSGSKESKLKACDAMFQNCDKTKTSIIRYEDVSDPLGQAQVKLADNVLLFVKGCGWLTSVTLPNVQSIEERRASKDLSGRRMSMEDYDKPNIRRLSLTGAS